MYIEELENNKITQKKDKLNLTKYGGGKTSQRSLIHFNDIC